MTYEEMEQTLTRLAHHQTEIQDLLQNAISSMSRFSDLVIGFAEGQNDRIIRLEEGLSKAESLIITLAETHDNRLTRLEDLVTSIAEQQNERTSRIEQGLIKVEDGLARLTMLVEAFLRGSGDGGRRES